MVAENSVTQTRHFRSPYMTPIWVQHMCLTRHWSYRHNLCFLWLVTVAPGRRRIEKGREGENPSLYFVTGWQKQGEDSFAAALKKTKKNKRKIRVFLLIISGNVYKELIVWSKFHSN